MKDNDGCPLSPISAVCGSFGTLCMFTKSGENERQLVLCDKETNGGKEVFLDAGNQEPVALFGGRLPAAAISKKVKSSSSIVIQSKTRLHRQSHRFLFQAARRHRVSRAATTQLLF